MQTTEKPPRADHDSGRPLARPGGEERDRAGECQLVPLEAAGQLALEPHVVVAEVGKDAVRAEQVVATGALIDAMWGADAPRTAAHALHVHASTLRKWLPEDLALVSRPGGYALRAGPDQLDADRFEALAARARAELASGHPDDAAALLRDALALWRGPALADVPWFGR